MMTGCRYSLCSDNLPRACWPKEFWALALSPQAVSRRMWAKGQAGTVPDDERLSSMIWDWVEVPITSLPPDIRACISFTSKILDAKVSTEVGDVTPRVIRQIWNFRARIAERYLHFSVQILGDPFQMGVFESGWFSIMRYLRPYLERSRKKLTESSFQSGAPN